MKRTYEQNKEKANRMNKRRFMRHHRELKLLHAMNKPETFSKAYEFSHKMKKYYAQLKEKAEAAGQWEAAYTFYTQMVECV